jgi:hypothetical protein
MAGLHADEQHESSPGRKLEDGRGEKLGMERNERRDETKS